MHNLPFSTALASSLKTLNRRGGVIGKRRSPTGNKEKTVELASRVFAYYPLGGE
jgi:hypothetical protein